MNCVQIWGYILTGMTEQLDNTVQETINAHSGHKLELVQYGGIYYAIECTDCHEVLFDDETLEQN